MSCTSCPKPQQHNDESKFNKIKLKANSQCKASGVTSFGMWKTVNPDPGYGWRPIGDPDLQGRTDVEYFTVV